MGHDRILKALDLRLRQTGKKPKVVFVACMRKLVVRRKRLFKTSILPLHSKPRCGRATPVGAPSLSQLPHHLRRRAHGLFDVRLAVRRGKKAGLELRWCEIDASLQHSVEEPLEPFSV